SVAVISAKNLPDGDPNTKVRITYETALKELKRAEKLIQDKIISTKEYEQIQLRHKTALTAFEAQSSNIVSNGVTVSAPIGGYVKNISVSQGEYVTVGQPIMTISENKRVQLRAEVSEKYFQDLKGVHSANFKMAYDDNIYKLSELNGRLLSFGKTSNEKSFFIPITFEFDNIGDIVTGSFAEVYLLSTPQKDVISIPISALTEEQGLYFVYLQIDEEGYKKQGVTLGDNNGERIRIVSGLKSGDKVVVKGAYQVKLASVSSVVPEGHNHNH
ncbi:MAG: efflux RND transporter periplasmic adaptor subunit, partial [Rikenellaceae bacterium]